ncbi:Cuticle protein 6 [Frankliniella fusca]|uniref:Cuticle protein 6 n=1 Tax=Frankliniella fusca TaxID=407009 RepID=A0AAE1H5N3_9NEOP|nr:Cuticle protein 6 [Frankliniella fusca]
MKSFIVLSCVLAVAVASYVPADTPEVAAAKAQHFAAHAQANARNWASDVVVNNHWVAAAPAWNSLWAARANWYAPSWQRYYSPAQISVVNGHVQDTPEVAAEKAKHFALVAEAQARSGGAYVSGEDDGQWYDDVHAVPLVKSWVAQPAVSHSYVKSYVTPTVVAARHHVQPAHVVVANGHVQDTPEVAAEKAKHLSIFAQTAARDAAAGSTEWADNAENWRAWGPGAAISTYAAVAPVVSSAYPAWTGEPANIVVANGHVQDTAEVVAEKAKHFALVAEAKARNAASGEEWSEVVAPVVSHVTPVVNHVAPAVVSRVAPVVSHVAPVAPVAAVADIHSQYHAQDEAGQYSYGYNGGLSTKNEEKTVDGVTRGAFSYVDSNGVVQSRSYVADALGFRVAATDLPVGPAPAGHVVAAAAPVATVYSAAAPVAVRAHHVPAQVVVKPDGTLEDTPEVAAAKAQHYAAHQQEHARLAGGAW